MEWWLVIIIMFGSFLTLMFLGLPVAFCFLVVDAVAAYFLWGGEAGFHVMTTSFVTSLTSFTLLPLPLYVLMGDILFEGGVTTVVIQAVDKWLGRLVGRLALMAVFTGTIVATFTGVSMASVAMLAKSLVPEMEKRGYKKAMSLGPILGSGGLAIMIPPSSMAVLIGVMGNISIGRMLLAIIVPGLLMAVMYAVYIIVRCKLQPDLAPAYEVSGVTMNEKMKALFLHIMPVMLIIFLVVGVMFLGIATPSEAAATGALGCFILAMLYRRLTFKALKSSLRGVVKITGMIFAIIMGAIVFGQILSSSGASRGLVNFATGLSVTPIAVMIAIQLVGVFLGMFMATAAVIMLVVPIVMPIVNAVHLDPVWFATIFVLNMEIATFTPPYGVNLFVIQAAGPPGTTMADCIRAAVPFILMDFLVMALIIVFPQITLWLPGLMHGA